MRKKERERLKDFQRGEDGRYVYAGDHVRLAGGTDRRRLLVTLWGACGVALLATVVAGVANPAGLSGCPYVVMPFMCQLVALVSVVWALGRLTVALRGSTAGRVRAYVRDETVGALPLRGAIAAACALVAAVGELVLLATGGAAVAPAEVALLSCEVVTVSALVVLRSTARAAEWEGA